MSTSAGSLFVVATPIGNLGDLGARAATTLGEADLIAAEDTRHTRRLLDHLGLRTPMISLHDHNEGERSAALVERMLAGADLALVSDAGTPLVSDPGFRLVRAARAASLRVLAVPGPCAAIAALSIAGLPSDRFVFEGFLPPRSAARQRRLQALAAEPRTMIFYVAPRQLQAQLADVADAFGATRPAGLARELTKIHETYYDATLAELYRLAGEDNNLSRGELVLLVAGAPPADDDGAAADRLLRELLAPGTVPLKTVVEIAARLSGQPRNTIYRRALELKREIDAESGES